MEENQHRSSTVSAVLNGISGGLALLCMACFGFGCFTSNTDETIVKGIYWFVAEQSGNKVYYGLNSFVTDYANSDFDVEYNSNSCIMSFCDKCNDDSKDTFGLLVTSAVFTMIMMALSFCLVANYSFWIQLINIILAVIPTILSASAVGLFMGDCRDSVSDYFDDHTDENWDISWGSGGIIPLVGMLLMFTIVILQLIAMCLNCSRSTAMADTNSY